MKNYAIIAIVLAVIGLSEKSQADDPRGFYHFKAPGVLGAYNSSRSPLGLTESGENFEIGFYLADDGESQPARFWIYKNTGKIMEIDSISAINVVIKNIVGDEPGEWQGAAEISRKLLALAVSGDGPTGLPLFLFKKGGVAALLERLKAAGLSSDAVAIIGHLVNETQEGVDKNANTWTSSWYEVNKLGGIEKVSLRGSIMPLILKSVEREELFESGTIPSTVLRRNIFFAK